MNYRCLRARAAVQYFYDEIDPAHKKEIEKVQTTLDHCHDMLMQAYYWAINGGSAQTGLVGQPLLIAYRNALVAPQQPQVVVVPAPAPVPPVPQVVAQPPAQTVIVPAPQRATANK